MGVTIAGTTSTQSLRAVSGTVAGDVGGSGALLPPPADGAVGAPAALTILLQLSSDMSTQQVRTAKTSINAAELRRTDAATKRREALDRAAEAARKAREEAEEDGGLFSFVTDNIGIVGLVGLCTFQWGLVAADVTAHQTDLADGATGVVDLGAAAVGGPLMYLAEQGMKDLAPGAMSQAGAAAMLLTGPVGYALERAAEKLGPGDYAKLLDETTSIKDDDVRVANKIALMVALSAVAATTVVLSGGTSLPAIAALVGIGISTGTQLAAQTGLLEKALGEKAAMYVALCGAIAGAALTLGGSIGSIVSAGNAVSAAPLAEKAKRAADAAETTKRIVAAANGGRAIVEGAHSVDEGVHALRRADYVHDGDVAKIDAEGQRHILARIEQIVDAILDDLKDARDAAERTASTLQEALQINNQTLLQAGAMKV